MPGRTTKNHAVEKEKPNTGQVLGFLGRVLLEDRLKLTEPTKEEV